jgi:hypothetical protein
MSRTTEQTNHASRSTATADAGETFVDPGTPEARFQSREPNQVMPVRYDPEKAHTLDDEIAELGKAFPYVAELLRTAVKYLA